VLRSRKLRLALGTVGMAAAVQVLALIPVPVASAAPCTVTVALPTGGTTTLTLDVPPGTPLSGIQLPIPGTVVSASCAPATTTSTTTSSPTTTAATTSSTSSSASPSSTTTSSTTTRPSSTTTSTTTTQTAPHTTTPGKKQRPSTRKQTTTTSTTTSTTTTSSRTKAKSKKPKKSKKKSKSSSAGVPSSSNPTFSFALPGAAPLGVPNFFIDSFRIPPFLLPIYQAAGIQYDVPWQILAAINEIETDYGRNLSVSSAGAVGWMQFLPSTWKQWGIDANGDKVADPYNPVDAIFSAARYLRAAGANKNVSQAIFAYNHASWYVQSVELRAKLIGGMPDQLIGALTGLVQGHFPVAAPSKYADNAVTALSKHHVKTANAAIPIGSDTSKATDIYAKQGSPVIAVNDGKIVKVGENAKWGKYIQLQDQTGNIYTYAQLGSIPADYPVPKPVKISAAQLTKELSAPVLPSPKAPASAGSQQTTPTVSTATATKVTDSHPSKLPATTSQPAADTSSWTSSSSTVSAPMVKERLFANPSRPRSFAAGGKLQLRSSPDQISSFQHYFSDVLHLGKNQYTLQPLKAGAVVVAGTILGRLGPGTPKQASHVRFMVQPAGKNAPQIDPKPILDGWKLLEATAVYRAAGVDPFFGPGAKNPSIGQILLMSKEQLQNRILQDPHVQIYACGRRDIQAGLVDRRVLATLEFLSSSGLDPQVSGLLCGRSSLPVSTGIGQAAVSSGSSVLIDKINNVPIQGHQGAGSVTDITIRRLLTLQGAMKPDQIVSTMSYKGQSNTLALPDHANEIEVTFTPLFGSNQKLSNEIKSILQPGQWVQLINRISQIPEPVVPIAPSKYAIRTAGH
jgi:Transglycosylase SLT domain/Peptidase family M23